MNAGHMLKSRKANSTTGNEPNPTTAIRNTRRYPWMTVTGGDRERLCSLCQFGSRAIGTRQSYAGIVSVMTEMVAVGD